MINLALLRHGHTAWNRAGQIQGRSDIALDDEAREGLRQLQLPSPWDQAALWSSPLSRADETARLVSGRAPQHAPELTEMNWGEWEGLKGRDLLENPTTDYRHIEDWGWNYRPPQGESPAEVWERLARWLQMLERDTVAVCHIGIMRVLLAKAHGWHFSGPAPFAVKRNRLFVLTVDTNSGLSLKPNPDPVRLVPKTGPA